MALIQQKNVKQMSYIELAVLLLFAAYFILPAGSSAVNTLTALGIGIAYLLFLLLAEPAMRRLTVTVFAAVVLVALLYTLLTDTQTIASTVENYKLKQFISKLHQYFMMYFPFLLAVRVWRRASKRQKMILLVFSLALIAYVVVITLRILALDPNATRDWTGKSEYGDKNLGKYYFIYAIPVLIATLTVFFARLRTWRKAVCLVAIVFLFWFLLNAQYTLAVLITLIGVAYQAVKSARSGVTKFLLIVSLLILCMFIPSILGLLIRISPSQQIALRLREVRVFLVGGGAGGYNLSGRLTLYGQTIKAFFESPLWGNRSLPFDGHATFLTVLSDTGLLGGVPFYFLVFSARRHLIRMLGSVGELFKPIVLMFVLMGLTNPIHGSLTLSYAIWLLAPLMLMTMLEKGNKKV